MAASNSDGTAGEITFLEGTSVSTLEGVGVGNYRKTWAPDSRLFRCGRRVGLGGSGALAGREGAAGALGPSPCGLGARPGAGRPRGRRWTGREPELVRVL